MIEYRIRPVGRFVVTQFYSDDESHNGKQGSRVIGEYGRHQDAELVARALAQADGGAYTSNILPDHDVPALLRNIADQFGGRAEDGVVILSMAGGGTEVFGIGPGNAESYPHDILAAGAKKLKSLGIKP